MKKVVLFYIFVCIHTAFSQKVTDTIPSRILNEDRQIVIGLPPSYDKNSNQKYPLVILLDGDFLFDPFQGALSYGNYWDDMPEVIMVGITQNKNNERETDCTVDQTTGIPIGKGNSFFEFISSELIPYIQKKYRIAPFKLIAGLDSTAAFSNFYLYQDNPVFDAYIAMSPELTAGMEEQIYNRLAALEKPIFYYHSTADGDVKKMRNRIQALDQEIKKINKTTLNYKFDDFIGASHYSLVLNSIPSALNHFFSVYQPISTTEFQEKIEKLPSGYVDYLIKKYEILEKTFSIKLKIRLNDFTAIEAAILKNKAYTEFEQLSQIARKNYPKSMLADYQLAQFYEKTGELKKAIKSYQTAFQKEEIGDLTRDMMIERLDQVKATLKNNTGEEIEEAIPTEMPKEEKKSE